MILSRQTIALLVLLSRAAIALPAADLIKDGARSAPPLAGWKLVWADEFDKAGLPDRQNWNFETGFMRGKELQWYQPDNAWCEEGFLIIEARPERKPNPNFDPHSHLWRKKRQYAEFTSASLTTQGLHSWLYGRFEMRGRISPTPGLHPCFWTLGLQGEWPSCGEIDIMEFHRGHLMANAAWASETNGTPRWKTVRKPISEFQDPTWPDRFHLWRMDWDENRIDLYVDDRLLNTIDLTQTINGNGNRENPFRRPHFLILDLAIERKPGDDPSQTSFPARFDVDYVRVYQRLSQEPPAAAATPREPQP